MTTLSEKAKVYLVKRSEAIQAKIMKLKRKENIMKTLYYSSVVLSITLSTTIASLSGFVGIPVVVISILSACSGILTGISAKFNFQDKSLEIKQLIEKLNKLNQTIDYVVTCNGDFSQSEYERIMKEFV
jgi:hypothetical protein